MEAAREILHMLILRKRVADKLRKRLDRRVIPQSRADFMDGQFCEADVAVQIARNIYKLSRGSAPHAEQERKRLIALSSQHKEFVVFDDGYTHYSPHGSISHGALTAWDLRTLADELDRRNRSWDARLRNALGQGQSDDD